MLSTADRAKAIKTRATVNEDPTEKMLRELTEENERLKKMVASGKVSESQIREEAGGEISKEELEQLKKEWMEEMQARMKNNDAEVQDIKMSSEEKKKAGAAAVAVNPQLLEIAKKKKENPHIYNLNVDPQLSGKVVHILPAGEVEIGNQKGSKSEIVMVGPGIHNQHCVLKRGKNNAVTVRPCEKDCRVLVNGSPVTGEADLDHNDRLVIGSTQLWVFQNPLEKGIDKKNYPPVTYEYAQEEIAAKAGVNIDHAASTDVALLQEDLCDVMPAVEEANSISEELDKRVKFEIVLIAPQLLGKMKGKAEVRSSIEGDEKCI